MQSKIMKKNAEGRRRNRIFQRSASNNIVFGVVMFVLVVICLVQLYLVLWMIMSSLKDDVDFFLDIFGLPSVFHFENYSSIFSLLRVEIFVAGRGYVTYNIWDMFLNSVLIALLTPINTIVMNILVAYVLSKIDFKAKGFLLGLNFIVMIIPIIGNLSSQLVINNMIGRYDNLFMMTIMGGQPFGMAVLMYMSAFKAIPNDYMDAASIDGAGYFQTFLKIMLPPVLPMALVFYMLAVMASWADYQTPLVWLPSYPNLAIGMYRFQFDVAKYGATMPQVLAGFVLMSIPSVLFFLANQSLITKNLMIGGLKG